MINKDATAEQLALMVVHQLEHGAAALQPHRATLHDRYQEVRSVLEQYPFDRFTNWGLQLGIPNRQPASANYMLRNYSAEERIDFTRRVMAIDHHELYAAVSAFCQERYNSRVLACSLFGGYVYGVTAQPDDLDLKVLLADSHVVENTVVFRWSRLPEIIDYPRKPLDKIGLTVIGIDQINPTTQNTTVLRTAVIMGTTAVPVFGLSSLVTPVPAAILLYHAVEMVTWGFKLCFEEHEQAHDRALWRVVEAGYVLRYINELINGPLPDRLQWLYALREHLAQSRPLPETSLAIFQNSMEQFRRDVLILKHTLREQAIKVLDQSMT